MVRAWRWSAQPCASLWRRGAGGRGRGSGWRLFPCEAALRAPRDGRRVLQGKARSPSCSHTSGGTDTISQGGSLRGERSLVSRPPLTLFPFQDIDKFGNEITQLARPLPVEYLIIDVSVCPGPGGSWLP